MFSFEYMLQIKVDYFVNLATCRLAVYWSVNVADLERCLKVLEFYSHSRRGSTLSLLYTTSTQLQNGGTIKTCTQ